MTVIKDDVLDDEEDYGGWSNYATWLVDDYLSQADSFAARAVLDGLILDTCVDDGDNEMDVAEVIENFVTDLPEVQQALKTEGVARELLLNALAEVDWIALAEMYIEEVIQLTHPVDLYESDKGVKVYAKKESRDTGPNSVVLGIRGMAEKRQSNNPEVHKDVRRRNRTPSESQK